MRQYQNPKKEIWSDIFKRAITNDIYLADKVNDIFMQVSQKGDAALLALTEKYDGPCLSTFKIETENISIAEEKLSKSLLQAIKKAYAHIYTFHKAQQVKEGRIETAPGVLCWREDRAIEKVAIYIPGGTAPLFSTVLMLGIPAQIAGCKQVVMVTPPNKNGVVNPAILYAAKLCGITEVYTVGGAQAIAALAVGTESIPKVDKIFGPGNSYVTCAKQLAQQKGVAIDMPAGPSEVLVIADESANPAFIASDLLAQAEHGPDSQVVLISTEKEMLERVATEIEQQLNTLPRKEVAKQALKNSLSIWVKSLDRAFELSNYYAPEHLIIMLKNAESLLAKIENAGSVFLGNYTPESAGDYASGTNHVLPTNYAARSYSGVALECFTKKVTIQKITAGGLQNIGPTVEVMAEAEQLLAHKRAVSIRLEALGEKNE